MAGIYGEIDSTADYQRVLREAISLVKSILTRRPDDVMMQLIYEEVDAMRRWSDGGREPSDDERASINVGLVAARELSAATGDEGKLVTKLFALNTYFEDWPTDEQAADGTDDSSMSEKIPPATRRP